MNEKEINYSLKKYMEEIVQNDLDKFDAFIRWGDSEREEFKVLLENFKKPYDKRIETTKSKGDRLENLVEFIIKKSYFSEIYKNVHTETNEIDEVIILSDRGKQAIKRFHLSRKLIPIEDDMFLGECKNYDTSLGVTYVANFIV